MLNHIEVKNTNGGVLTLPIYNPTKFTIKDIQGLDPVKANVVTSNFSQMDGVQYQTSRREMRNIIFNLAIDTSNTIGTVQNLRKELYSYFSPKTEVEIKFVNDSMETVLIKGLIESFDSLMFIKNPEATISILCFDPDFYSETNYVFTGASVSTPTNSSIIYNGDVDSGFIFTLNINRTVTDFSIQNTLPDGSVRTMTFNGYTFLANDVLTVSTVPGNKYVNLTRSGVVSSVLYSLDTASDWLKLYPGENLLRTNITGLSIPYTISYNLKYGGL